MKKTILIIITVFLNLGLLSCTDNDELVTKEYVDSSIQANENCCGEDGEILPPPPPPPKGD